MLLENIRSIGQLLRKVDTKTCRVCIYRQYGAPHFSIIFAYKVSNVELILYNSITNNIRRHSTTREVQRLIDKYGCPGIYRYLTSDAECEHAMMMTRIIQVASYWMSILMRWKPGKNPGISFEGGIE